MNYKRILVTGGAGFIGTNFIYYLFEQKDFEGICINVDSLTYAGNIHNLDAINNEYGGSRYFFEHCDICNFEKLEQVFKNYNPDCVVHFAAESHVDRSIHGPKAFIYTINRSIKTTHTALVNEAPSAAGLIGTFVLGSII